MKNGDDDIIIRKCNISMNIKVIDINQLYNIYQCFTTKDISTTISSLVIQIFTVYGSNQLMMISKESMNLMKH